jgi:hypothetical protein
VLSEHDMLVKPPTPRGRRDGGLNWLTWAVLGVFLAGAVAGGYYLYANFLSSQFEEPDAKKRRLVANFAYYGPAGWRADKRLQQGMNADIGMSHTGPRAHLAIYFHDYEFRTPSDEELVEGAVKRLKESFRRVEYIDPLQSGGKGRSGSLGGEEALAMTFQATGEDNVRMIGECHMLSRRGYAYWLMAWGPESEAEELPDLWEPVRAGFKHGDGRDGWQPTPRPTVPFEIPGRGLQVRYAEEEWQPAENAKTFSPAAVLALTGYELTKEDGRLRRVPYAGKSATVTVLALPQAADIDAAVAAARNHILTQTSLKAFDMVKVTAIKDRGSGKPLVETKVGELPGQAHHLLFEVGKDEALFGLLAVVRREDGVVAIYCECPEAKRAYWLAEFKAVVNSLAPK